jgi:LacI family transcriptional regulator
MAARGSTSKPAAAAKISDVARAAGVSSATVSRVMNGSGTVSPARAERVLAAASALGYQPFGPARALRQQRTRVWAAIVADIENPFFTAMVRGIEDVARDVGHRLVLCNSDNDVAREAAYIEDAIAERMAGVVIAVASAEGSSLGRLLSSNVPVVTVDRRSARHHAEVDSVLVDNRAGARAATEHLLERGARLVACVTGPRGVSTADERAIGYRDAVRAVKGTEYVVRADFKQGGGYDAVHRMLAGGGRRPDAVFVANNLMTLGALQALRDLGLDVPGAVRLAGFDDAPWTTLIDPPLTVVAQPTYEIGREAARLLVTTPEAQHPRHVVLAPSLVVRASS